ncbi:protein SOSEKI 5-like isoform X2 [Zingiber officinale]|uniref:SOSEKI DIX-like domain-containing protein n=1 Tax=Zingiber officinale TaxID=94328 RepID=A0A8J5ERB1_ZINOF|nr:protein SOSEKI 5-like isoform X2 [Zingiber officinale]KAG6473822.1 hypothetical protein ZIOFF_067740 [Zingiber officinale]
MAIASRGRAELTSKTSAESTKVWTEPRPRPKAQVVYYVSRNGNLDQPHFMEVPFSSAEGLYLRDVISRLHVLRGRGMADMYSWSCKRNYRNGYVWHDLLGDDFIHPVHRNEYVLKGTHILHFYSSSSASMESSASSSVGSGKSLETQKRVQGDTFPSSTINSSDAPTQTDEHRSHRRRSDPTEENQDEKPKTLTMVENPASELSREEISSPSPDTLEALIKEDGCRIVTAESEEKERVEGGCLSGRVKATSALMHLISCGSTSAKASALSSLPQCKGRTVGPIGVHGPLSELAGNEIGGGVLEQEVGREQYDAGSGNSSTCQA